MNTNCIVTVPDLPAHFLLGDGAHDLEIRHGAMRRLRLGLNPDLDILDPAFLARDAGGQHGDLIAASGEGGIGEIGGEEAETAGPVFLRGRGPSAVVVVEEAVQEILGGRVAGIGPQLDRLIGQGLGAAHLIDADDDRTRGLERGEPDHADGQQQHQGPEPDRQDPQVPVGVDGLPPDLGIFLAGIGRLPGFLGHISLPIPPLSRGVSLSMRPPVRPTARVPSVRRPHRLHRRRVGWRGSPPSAPTGCRRP